MYVNNHADRAVQCVAIAVGELCDIRESDDTQVFSGSELKYMIDNNNNIFISYMLHVFVNSTL